MQPDHAQILCEKDKRLLVLLCLGAMILAWQADFFPAPELSGKWQWRQEGGHDAAIFRLSGNDTAPVRPGPRLSFLLGRPMSVNLATTEELQLLPGIGSHLAQSIIDYRREHGSIHSAAAFRSVPGIGPRLTNRLSPLLSFQ